MITAGLLLVGLGVGVAVGWLLQRLNTKPVVQSALAMQLGWMLASFASGIILMMHAVSTGHGIAALSFGVGEIALSSFVIALVAAGIHSLLGWLAPSNPGLLARRAVLLGTIGGLCGVLAALPLGIAVEP